ncbi:ATP-binding protein [Streptomyces olivaceus]|uniref:ATP-binding protein n=1 Tax=Streptomyces olivaceus TaxID=47716 RepID=UPI003F4B5DBF
MRTSDRAAPAPATAATRRAAARPRTGGSGLGLAIAHENAALHDGSLTAANHPAGGAVFTLTLPLAPPQDASSRGTT